MTQPTALPSGFVAPTWRDAIEAESQARAMLGVPHVTQGKCEPCGRFFYFAGPLHRARCPRCGLPLRRTSHQSKLPRLVILRQTARETRFGHIQPSPFDRREAERLEGK